MTENDLLNEEKEIERIIQEYDLDLKHLFGKYKIIALYKSKVGNEIINVVYLHSVEEAYEDVASSTVSHAHRKGNTIFINLTKKDGHWYKGEYTSIYCITELASTFLHELLHVIINPKDEQINKEKEEKSIVELEKFLRNFLDYKVIVME